MSSLVASHYSITSLSTCSNASCIRYCLPYRSNIVQICMATILLFWLIFEFIMHIKLHMRLHFSWQQIMFVQIFLSLSFNICFTLWSDVIIWYVMQSFIYQIYFTTLVYYFTMKYLQKKIKIEERKPYIVGLIIAYAVFCLAELGLFVALVNQGVKRCKVIGEIIIDAVMIALGIMFFYLAFRNQSEELQKFEEFKVRSEAKSPLRDVWIWVCLNIIGQIVKQIENILLYVTYGQDQCVPVSNLQSDILSPIFMFCTYFISFSSTLWFYHQKRISQEESYQITFTQLELSSAQADIDNKVQIVKLPSFNESSYGNLNDPLL